MVCDLELNVVVAAGEHSLEEGCDASETLRSNVRQYNQDLLVSFYNILPRGYVVVLWGSEYDL